MYSCTVAFFLHLEINISEFFIPLCCVSKFVSVRKITEPLNLLCNIFANKIKSKACIAVFINCLLMTINVGQHFTKDELTIY